MQNVFMKKVRFQATPSRIFNIFAEAEVRNAVTGLKTSGNVQAGEEFTDAAAKVRGKTLYAEPERLIVQSWRSTAWKKDAEDSILVLRFRASGSGAELYLTQSGLPGDAAAEVKRYWNDRFWKPIKDYLKAEKKAATPSKPRGRPRKAAAAQGTAAKTSKARGRPPKAEASADATVALEPRKRGRPGKAPAAKAGKPAGKPPVKAGSAPKPRAKKTADAKSSPKRAKKSK